MVQSEQGSVSPVGRLLEHWVQTLLPAPALFLTPAGSLERAKPQPLRAPVGSRTLQGHQHRLHCGKANDWSPLLSQTGFFLYLFFCLSRYHRAGEGEHQLPLPASAAFGRPRSSSSSAERAGLHTSPESCPSTPSRSRRGETCPPPPSRCPPQTFNSFSSDVNLGGGAQVKFNMLSWGSFI